MVAPKPKLDIPVPKINIVDTYERDVKADYEIPVSFVRCHRGRAPLTEIDYLADLEDETWLSQNSRCGGKAPTGRARLTVDMFEHMIDALEKATAFEAIVSFDQAMRIFVKASPNLTEMFPTVAPTKGSGSRVLLKHVSSDVYQYWVHKRSKLKRPLLRKFWPVTSSDDTNPHLVFRPREKEKYQLRRKRHPDNVLARRKLQALRQELGQLRQVIELVQRREGLQQAHLQTTMELFSQRLYDMVDTTGKPRPCKNGLLAKINSLIENPLAENSGRLSKKARTSSGSLRSGGSGGTSNAGQGGGSSDSSSKVIVAGHNNGEPAPHFLHPLETRESYATSYATANPSMPTYEDSHAQPTTWYRHRTRVGRGGRLVIDRVPRPPVSEHHRTMVTAGRGLAQPANRTRLLDYLPPQPIDAAQMARQIENHSLNTLMGEDNAVVVSTESWMSTDDPVWGDERFSLGPV